MTNKTIIKITPSDNLFKELGNNTYDFVDLISEFIDNSIAAKKDDEILKVEIEIGLSKFDEQKSYFKIMDNARGIKRENIGLALSPGGTSGGNTLNEHGLGMKQAIAALGKLEYLITKTEEDTHAVKINELRFGEIDAEIIDANFSHGTHIKVNNINSIVPTNTQKYTKNVNYVLGARYRRFLREDSPKMKLSIKIINIDLNKQENIWNIKECNPVYFHPNTRRNEPMIEKKEIKGRGWKARLTFGYAPNDKQYEEIGLEPPKNYMPYKVSINKQGLDIINNDRVIKFHQLSEIDLVSTRHNKYNYVRGEIDLISGFTTAITKNNVIVDNNFNELIDKIKEILGQKDYLEKKSYPDEIPENLLRDRLKKFFETSKMFKKNNVQSEYPVDGLGGFIDILADGEPWELKIGDADGLDVYQLFAYMDMGNFKKGYLVAKSFKTGAQSAANFINSNHDKTIELIERKEFPINNQPTDEEIKEYY